jgi:hypothetical protein
MLTGAHQTQRRALASTFLDRYHKDGNGFLNQIIRVTGVETWVTFVNVETKKQPNGGCTHIHQRSRNSLNKRCLPARKLMATVFWNRKGVLVVVLKQQRQKCIVKH